MSKPKQTHPNQELVGRKVVCINDDFSNAPPLYRIIFEFPRAGKIYTIRAVLDFSFLLEEIVNPVVTWNSRGVIGEISFDKPRFRAVQDFEVDRAIEELISLRIARAED